MKKIFLFNKQQTKKQMKIHTHTQEPNYVPFHNLNG